MASRANQRVTNLAASVRRPPETTSDISDRPRPRRADQSELRSQPSAAVAETEASRWTGQRPVGTRPEEHLSGGQDGRPIATSLDAPGTLDSAKTWRAQISPATKTSQ